MLKIIRILCLCCFISLFFVFIADATQYIVTPAKNDCPGASIACEIIEIPYWQFLFWLVTVQFLSVVDVPYLTKFIFVIAGCRDVLGNTSQSRVYTYIKTKPGAYISEIEEELGLARGTVKRYVHVLRVINKIESYKDGGKIRYFAATTYNEEEKRVISALQNTNNKKIITEIQSGRCITNIDLAREFGFSRATISWYVSNLKEIGLIEETKKGKTRIYRINDSYNSLFNFLDDK